MRSRIFCFQLVNDRKGVQMGEKDRWLKDMGEVISLKRPKREDTGCDGDLRKERLPPLCGTNMSLRAQS